MVLDQGYLVYFELESHHFQHHPVSHNLACKNLLSHQLNRQAMFPQLAVKKLVNLFVSFVVLKGLLFHFQLSFKGVQPLNFSGWTSTKCWLSLKFLFYWTLFLGTLYPISKITDMIRMIEKYPKSIVWLFILESFYCKVKCINSFWIISYNTAVDYHLLN